jgi:single-stranded DNA-binding protein
MSNIVGLRKERDMARGIEAACWGSATKDGEVRQSKAGNAFGIVSIAVNDGKIDDQGREQSTFIKVLLFTALAHEAANIKKG